MNDELDTFYLNPDTQERVRVMYRVHLTMPAVYDGYVDVEATSEEGAAREALELHASEIEWEFDDVGDIDGLAVHCVDCEEPPLYVALIRPNCTSNAILGDLIECDAPSCVPEASVLGLAEGKRMERISELMDECLSQLVSEGCISEVDRDSIDDQVWFCLTGVH